MLSYYPYTRSFNDGAPVELEAVPASGYEFVNWEVNDVASGSDNPKTIYMTCARRVTAHFTQVTYNLTALVTPTGGGMVTLDPPQPVGGYVDGAQVTLTAVANGEYEFDHWSGDLSGSDNPTTIIMDSDKVVTAHFTQVAFTLAVDVSPPGGGTVTLEPSPPAEGYVGGTEVTLTAVANGEYEFDHWSGDLSGSENPTTITMDSDKEVTAHFAQVTYDLTVSVSPSGGTVSLEPSPSAGGYVVGTEVTLTAVASWGYEFDHWSGSLSGSENPTTITMDSAKEVTAYFTQSTCTVTVEISPSDGGTVTLEPSQPAGGYVVGTEVTLTFVADEGYKFDHWEIASIALTCITGRGSKNPTTITIGLETERVVTAYFAEVTSSPFPWWWIVFGVGVVVVGLLVYFLIIRRWQA